jgi:glycosyltransferase involved in cell wall biosynthesis
MTDLLTIIVPVYNVEHYLEKSIQSICGQTYGNLQILLIDDGSTDGSLTICKEWEQRDARVKVYTQKNAGVAKTRNRGLALAEGKYVMFVDADDWIEADMLRTMYDLAEENHADAATCMLREVTPEDSDRLFEENHSGEAVEPKPCNVRKTAAYHTREESGLALLSVWGPVCKLYKTDIVSGIRFKEYKVAEDLLFNTDVICSEAFQCVVTIAYPFYHYVIYPGSAMQQSFQQKYLEAMKVEALCYEKLTAISPKYADINLIGCSVSRVFEKYAQLSKAGKKEHREDFRYCKRFAKAHKKALLTTTDRHRRISGWVKVYVPDLYVWILGIRKRREES